MRIFKMRKPVQTMMPLMTTMMNQSEGGLLHRLGHLQHHLLCFYLCCSLWVCSHQLHRDVCSEVYRNQLHRNNHHHHLYICCGHHHHQFIILDQIQGRRGGQETSLTSGKDARKGDLKIIMISVFKFPQIFTKNQEPVSRFFWLCCNIVCINMCVCESPSTIGFHSIAKANHLPLCDFCIHSEGAVEAYWFDLFSVEDKWPEKIYGGWGGSWERFRSWGGQW